VGSLARAIVPSRRRKAIDEILILSVVPVFQYSSGGNRFMVPHRVARICAILDRMENNHLAKLSWVLHDLQRNTTRLDGSKHMGDALLRAFPLIELLCGSGYAVRKGCILVVGVWALVSAKVRMTHSKHTVGALSRR
jgi:hypothetical protein